MFAQLPPDIASQLPAKLAAYISLSLILLTFIGRAITAIRNEGGLAAIWRSIFMGSSTTTQAEPNNSTMTPVLTMNPSASVALSPNSPVVPPQPSSVAKAIVPLVLVSILALSLTACTTTSGSAAISSTNGVLYVYGNQVSTNAVQSSLKSLAAAGATYAMAKDTNAAAYFQAANAVISALVNGGVYDSASLQSALSSVSVNAVKNNTEVQDAIASILSVYAATEAQAVTAKVDSIAYLSAALRGINLGFNQALGIPPNSMLKFEREQADEAVMNLEYQFGPIRLGQIDSIPIIFDIQIEESADAIIRLQSQLREYGI